MTNDICGRRLRHVVEQVVGSGDDVEYRSAASGRPLRGKIKRQAGQRVLVYSSNDRYGYHGAFVAQFEGAQWCVVDEAFDQSRETSKRDLLDSLIERGGG